MYSSNRHTQQLTECLYWFSDLWSEGYYDKERGQVEANKTVSTCKIVKQKQVLIAYSEQCQICDPQRREFSFRTRDEASGTQSFMWQKFYYSEKGMEKTSDIDL